MASDEDAKKQRALRVLAHLWPLAVVCALLGRFLVLPNTHPVDVNFQGGATTAEFPPPPFRLRSSRVVVDGLRLTDTPIPAEIVVSEHGLIETVLYGDNLNAAIRNDSRNEHAGLPVVDVTPLVVMPGLIDPHVHINEPGRYGAQVLNLKPCIRV